MEEFIGCDAHKKFSVFVAVNEKGQAGEALRAAHDRQLCREFLARLPAHSAIAVEASGSYSWLVDEMEWSGHRPTLCNPLEAKRRRGLTGQKFVGQKREQMPHRLRARNDSFCRIRSSCRRTTSLVVLLVRVDIGGRQDSWSCRSGCHEASGKLIANWTANIRMKGNNQSHWLPITPKAAGLAR